jgi:DNA repair exonuclease SbcCD ATPase subunit
MKIVHVADVHIRLQKYYKQYREIFNEFYQKIEEIKPDYVFIVGDLNHSKVHISPESVELKTEFLRNISDITKTHLILGNHDFNQKNIDKLDSLSPIVEALNHPNLYFHKYSNVISLNENTNLYVLSILDKKWDFELDKNKTNIALFHGSIIGSITETGFSMKSGEIDLEFLKQFDYSLLGDIHKRQQLDIEGRIRYCGSMISQAFSEENEKGFLLWDIKDKNEFRSDFISLHNPNPFVTIELNGEELSENINIPFDARVRIISNCNVSYELVQKYKQIITNKFKPESIIYQNNGKIDKSLSSSLFDDNQQENLRDIDVQERLIKDYLKDYDISNDILNKVLELNKKYKVIIDNDEEEVKRNIYWKIKTLEWDNLFNFEEGNKIDFTNLKGITGIFGKSFSGKSSIVEVILYIIFNSSSKNVRKNYDIINQNKNVGCGKIEIEANGKSYFISRTSEKYDKKLRGNTTEEAKTSVDFFSIDSNGKHEPLNGTERNDTDNVIRKIFGTKEDFLLTNMSSQFGFLSFINEGSTKRKEILAKFLDLELFERKHKMAKEDLGNIKGVLKKLESKNYDVEINEISKQLLENRVTLKNQREKCDKTKEEVKQKYIDIDIISTKLGTKPIEIIDYKLIQKKLENKENIIRNLRIKNEENKKQLEEKENNLNKIEQFINNDFDIDSYKKKKEEIKEKTLTLKNLQETINHKNNILDFNEKKTKLLNEVPCGEQYPHCKFIKDAFEAKEIVNDLRKEIESLVRDKENKQKELDKLDINKVDEYIKKYEQLVEKRNKTSSEISSLKTLIHKSDIELINGDKEFEELNQKLEEYNKNKDVIENYESILREKKQKENDVKQLEDVLSNCEKEILKLYKKHGSLEQQINELNKQKEELETLRQEYSAFEIFQECFGNDGIAYEIIKRKLPLINNEISKILTNVVPFEIFLESNGKKLEILIKHPFFDPRPLEPTSGAEKIIAALAIRNSFLKVSNLPRASTLVLDEPTGFDEAVMEGFIKMLDALKQEFDQILLISHLDSLKEIVDMEIVIEKKEKYAYVNQ